MDNTFVNQRGDDYETLSAKFRHLESDYKNLDKLYRLLLERFNNLQNAPDNSPRTAARSAIKPGQPSLKNPASFPANNLDLEIQFKRLQTAYDNLLMERDQWIIERNRLLDQLELPASFLYEGNLANEIYDVFAPEHTQAQNPYHKPLLTTGKYGQGPGQAAPAVQLAEKPPGCKPDLLIFSIIEFEERFQRPQQLAVHFARLGYRVFYVSSARYVSPWDDEPYAVKELSPGVYELCLAARRPPEIYSEIVNEALLADFLTSFEAARSALGIYGV